jgi:lipopolysaccharide export LptBFGC system permease protein LptF
MRRAEEELRRWDAVYPDRERAKRLTFAYHQRYAIAGSPLTLALLALLLTPRRRVGRITAAVISCTVIACAVIVFRLGWFLSYVDIVSAPIGAWFLHIVAVTTTVLAAISGRWRNLPLTRTRA